MKTVLIIKGGGGTEHEVSLRSADYIETQIDQEKFQVISVEISKESTWLYQSSPCELTFDHYLKTNNNNIKIDIVIPCLHGYPGETGEIPAFLDLIKLPYLGCNAETSIICFNKLLTKLTLELVGVPTTPFLQVQNKNDLENAEVFLQKYGTVFIKATNQGSSVGCYQVNNLQDLKKYIEEAFNYSPFVILEEGLSGRELEVSAFEYKGKWHVTIPGEIKCPAKFYSYEEKYSTDSQTETLIEAPDISVEVKKQIQKFSFRAIEGLKLRHLSRIDFFLTDDGRVYLNEPNTFPGHTQISMFPIMMENYGVKYSEFINSHLEALS